MSSKRSRATYEADLTAQQSPFVVFGTPLPPLDPDVRDDGSFVPVWKQEARDDQGRKRFHGAFTGGWSAGYYNTVGSKEGWTPSTFVSSRTNRHKDGSKAAPLQRAEDYMDEEDLAHAEQTRKVHITDAFAGLGSTAGAAPSTKGLMGLFRVQGTTMGTKLLQRMGWREGQGVGPKVRRKARLEVRRVNTQRDDDHDGDTFLFAPENVAMIRFDRKLDRKGLGFEGQVRLNPAAGALGRDEKPEDDQEDDENDDGPFARPNSAMAPAAKKKAPGGQKRRGLGIGVLNDTGSDEEDPYELGPRISYNRVIGGEKKKKKVAVGTNPALKAKPTFVSSKKSALDRVAQGLRKCHDGRLPLDGFVLASTADPLLSPANSEGNYPPPQVPPGWKSSKQQPGDGARKSASEAFVSAADAAKASTLDPKSRATILGEQQLPGKSVFDFLTPAARERLAVATGRTDLPPARSEALPATAAAAAAAEGGGGGGGRGAAGSGGSKPQASEDERVLERMPKLDRDMAAAALARGASGGAPYADNDAKRSRYRAYLESQAGQLGTKALPVKRPAGMSRDDWAREFDEFYNCARIFRPMTGLMASRFTTSSSASTSLLPSSSVNVAAEAGQQDGRVADAGGLITKPATVKKPEDPAEEAARMGMFGQLTRSVADFYPARLLCKRFGVKPPAHVQADKEGGGGTGGRQGGKSQFDVYGIPDLLSLRPSQLGRDKLKDGGDATAGEGRVTEAEEAVATVVDPTTNEALEGERAGEDLFRAIFGDSDEE